MTSNLAADAIKQIQESMEGPLQSMAETTAPVA